MAKEIRITFKEKESDLYDYIQSKSSASAFLKDLARIEQKRENIYLGVTPVVVPTEKVDNEKEIETIDINDMDISDLE
ncbi:hypothetical protein [Clostridium perfringens]|uniref:hypothetical protein n=1 Tax=Clostridium perfringens TaxID=1502 RepID=UPI00096AAC9A|nr:hypothetical protein [Clostridium perfringens]STB59716.1 Uncharacterised protein [Clostridium perfringens]